MANEFVTKILQSTIELWDNPHFYARIFNLQPDVHELVESTFDHTMFEYSVLSGEASLLQRADVEYAKTHQELQLLQIKGNSVEHTTLELNNPEGDYTDWRNWLIEYKDEFEGIFPVYADSTQLHTGKETLAYNCNKADKVGAKVRIRFDDENTLELRLLRHEPEDPRTMYRFYTEYAVQKVSGELAHHYLINSLFK